MAYLAAAQKGMSILLQKGATTIGGFRTRSFSINAEIVDVSTADDTNRYRQLLAAAGFKSISFSGDGVVKDTAAQQAMITDILAQTNDTYTLTWPGIGTLVGLFTISKFDAAGPQNGEATFTVSLESAGDIVFTAEA